MQTHVGARVPSPLGAVWLFARPLGSSGPSLVVVAVFFPSPLVLFDQAGRDLVPSVFWLFPKLLVLGDRMIVKRGSGSGGQVIRNFVAAMAMFLAKLGRL